MNRPTLDSLEAIYYSAPAPYSLEALTMLSLVFDKIHFPAVYVPSKGVIDIEETRKKRISLIENPRGDVDYRNAVNALWVAENIEYLEEFCTFAGEPGISTADDETFSLSLALEELIFGPRPEGNTPFRRSNRVMGLPGEDSERCQISLPFWSDYCARALKYSAEHGIPLVTDDPRIPVPGIPHPPKIDTQLLSMILTFECINFVLPKVPSMTCEQIRDFRDENASVLKPFRLEMLEMSWELDKAICSNADIEEIRQKAKKLVEMKIYPRLCELENVINTPTKRWYRYAAELGVVVADLATSYATLPVGFTIAKAAFKANVLLADFEDARRKKAGDISRTGLHYLLKVEKLGK